MSKSMTIGSIVENVDFNVIGSIATDKFLAPTISGASSYGVGENKQVLMSNGESIYWGNLDTDYIITPQMFGAVGDGATDDTAAFQAALDYCRTLYADLAAGGYKVHSRANTFPCLTVPDGKYLITSSLRLGTATYIRGEGSPLLIGDNTMRSTDVRAFLFVKEDRFRDRAPEGWTMPQDAYGKEGALPMHIVIIENLGFLNFYGCFKLDNSVTTYNSDGSVKYEHDGCESSFFDFSHINAKGGEYFIKGQYVDSGILNIHHSIIETITHIYEGGCDKVNISNNWLALGYFENRWDGAIRLTNNCTDSIIELSFVDNLCVCENPVSYRGYPGATTSTGYTGVHDYAWISVETLARVYVRRNHCGGENGGATVVNWKAPFVASGDSAHPKTVLVVEDSQIQTSAQTSADEADTADLHCGIRLFTMPNILSVCNNYGLNYTKYLISVRESYSSSTQLFTKVTEKVNNVWTSVTKETPVFPHDNYGGIYWKIENNDFSGRTPGGSIVHPFLYQFLNASYNKSENYLGGIPSVQGLGSTQTYCSEGVSYNSSTMKYEIKIQAPMFKLSDPFIGTFTVAITPSNSTTPSSVHFFSKRKYAISWGQYWDYANSKVTYQPQLTELVNHPGSDRDAWQGIGAVTIKEYTNTYIILQVASQQASKMYATLKADLDFNNVYSI